LCKYGYTSTVKEEFGDLEVKGLGSYASGFFSVVRSSKEIRSCADQICMSNFGIGYEISLKDTEPCSVMNFTSLFPLGFYTIFLCL
jgi:hypothetical protein